MLLHVEVGLSGQCLSVCLSVCLVFGLAPRSALHPAHVDDSIIYICKASQGLLPSLDQGPKVRRPLVPRRHGRRSAATASKMSAALPKATGHDMATDSDETESHNLDAQRRGTRHNSVPNGTAPNGTAATSPTAASTRELRRGGPAPASARIPAAPGPGSPAMASPLRYDRSICRRRVRVWWNSEAAWFGGRIKDFDSVTSLHIVRYDDGDQQSHPFNDPACL